MKALPIVSLDDLEDRVPAHALVADVDLVVIRFDDEVSVLYGRCAHRGALMADGHVDGDNLICGVHGWDYRLDTGVSEYNNTETLPKFSAWIEDGEVLVDEDEIARLGESASAALPARRLPGRLPGPDRHGRRAPRQASSASSPTRA